MYVSIHLNKKGWNHWRNDENYYSMLLRDHSVEDEISIQR